MTEKESSFTVTRSLKSLFDSICPNKPCAETHEDKALCPNEDKDSTWATAGSDVILQLSGVPKKNIEATIFVMNPKVRVSGQGSASCPTTRQDVHGVQAWHKESSMICGPWPVKREESSPDRPPYLIKDEDVREAVQKATNATRVFFKDKSEDPSNDWSESEQAASLDDLLKPEHLNQAIKATFDAGSQGAQ